MEECRKGRVRKHLNIVLKYKYIKEVWGEIREKRVLGRDCFCNLSQTP